MTYLVYTTAEEGLGGVYLWWKKGGKGYTRYLDEAGLFSLDEAALAVRSGDNVGAVPLEVAEGNSSKVLKIGVLHEGLEPGLHGVAPPADCTCRPGETWHQPECPANTYTHPPRVSR